MHMQKKCDNDTPYYVDYARLVAADDDDTRMMMISVDCNAAKYEMSETLLITMGLHVI